MSNTFYLEIVTPERKFFSDNVEMVILNTPEGEIGVLKDHMPMVVSVAIGPIRIKRDGDWHQAILTQGFMQIKQDKTIILTDTAEWPEEVDINRAKAAKLRAEERLQSKISQVEYIRSQAALARAVERLKATRHM
jgi:F-type H+-transporting ATPase subunit epsilon